MQTRMAGFRGEFLWELDVPEIQLIALAEAMPADSYAWRPAASARSFSEVLVHVAAGNCLLLSMVEHGAAFGVDLYGTLPADALPRLLAMIDRNVALEKTVTDKDAVLDLLRKSFEAVRRCFAGASDGELDRAGQFFGELTTVRRVYLRMLAHTHEHMGQAIAYARAAGFRVPWPDPLEEAKRLPQSQPQAVGI